MKHTIIKDLAESRALEVNGPDRLPFIESRIRQSLFGSASIVDPSRPLLDGAPQKAGIYFLIWDDLICYVGQSVDIYARVVEHVKQKRCIDKIACIVGVPKWWQSELEHAYILGFDPPWNSERSRRGQLSEMPDIEELARGLDRSGVMPSYIPVVEPCSVEQAYPQWKMQILGRVQSMGYKHLAF